MEDNLPLSIRIEAISHPLACSGERKSAGKTPLQAPSCTPARTCDVTRSAVVRTGLELREICGLRSKSNGKRTITKISNFVVAINCYDHIIPQMCAINLS